MFLKTVFLIFFGLCAGGVIAAGVYAFLAIIGVFVRLMGRTGTKNKVLLYESFIMAGGILGNCFDLYEFAHPQPPDRPGRRASISDFRNCGGKTGRIAALLFKWHG